MYYVKHTGNAKRLRLILPLALIILLAGIVSLESMLRQTVFDAAEHRANADFYRTVSRAALEAFPEDTQGLTLISSDSESSVTSVSVNSALASRINSNIALLTEQHIRSSPNQLPIPIGTLTGSTLLTGRGPKITVRITGYSGINAELFSEFSDAGINQTLHRVVCKVTANSIIMSGGRSRKITLSATVVLCETVIVGRVPGSYTIVNGDQSDTVGRIFDYGDPYGSDVTG